MDQRLTAADVANRAPRAVRQTSGDPREGWVDVAGEGDRVVHVVGALQGRRRRAVRGLRWRGAALNGRVYNTHTSHISH